MRTTAILITTALALATTVCGHAVALDTPADVQQQVAAAQAAEDNSHPIEAARLWTPLAEQGVAVAQMHLGKLYLRGYGVCRDEAVAEQWLLKAASQGLAEASQDLGDLYDREGPLHEPVKATQWYQKAADEGDTNAQYKLSSLYWQGKTITADHAKAIYWLEKAVTQKLARARDPMGSIYAYYLAVMYADDAEKSPDYERAAYWYLQSANRGVVPDAQSKLGGLYEKGLGVTQDYIEAYKWYAIAADEKRDNSDEQSLQEDIRAMSGMLAKMTSSQIIEAKKRVQAFHLIPTDPLMPNISQPDENCPSNTQ